MKLFRPAHSAGRSSIKAPKLSSHLVKPARFSSSKVKLSAPKFGKGRSIKVKI